MPRTSCLVIFGKNALEIKGDISLIAAHQVDVHPFVDLNDLTIEIPQSKYITFEPDFWRLDGSYKFMPAADAHAGYMTAVLSGSDGVFALPSPELEIVFDGLHSTNGITLHFSELTGDWASEIEIFFHDETSQIRHDTYTPTSAEFFTNQAVSDFKRIVIIFKKTNKPYRFARLMRIDFDTLIRLEGNEVKEAHLIEQIDPSRKTLPFNTIDLVLFSADEDFSIAAPGGYYANLQYYEPIEVYEHIDDDLIFIGRFYLEEWEAASENEANFHLIDAIGLMDTLPDPAGYVSNAGGALDTFTDFFAEIDIPFNLQPVYNTNAVTGWIPIGTRRESLQKMLLTLTHAQGLGVATCARSQGVEIKQILFASDIVTPDWTITRNEKEQNSKLAQRPPVTRVDITTYFNNVGASEQIFSQPMAAGTHRVEFDALYKDLTITGATNVTAGTYVDFSFGYNYIDLNVASPGTVTVEGKKVTPHKYPVSEVNTSLPAGTKEKIITIDSTTMFDIDGERYAEATMHYFKQRYVEKMRLFAPRLTVGESVLVDTQSGKQLIGIVEKLTTDLARGFVADVEVVGIIVEE